MTLAAVMQGPGQLEVAEFPRPEPRDGEVLMRVLLSGVCGTDKHTYRGETKQYAGTAHERELRYPLICGHENVGVVEEVGPGGALASDGRPLSPGDRIVPGANVPCRRCHFCLAGAPYYFCENLDDYGNSLGCSDPPHLFGGWAEHMVLLPGTPIFRVPDVLPDEVAVLTEPMSVTHGLDTARSLAPGLGGTAFGDSVAVVGVGPLGLCHLVKAASPRLREADRDRSPAFTARVRGGARRDADAERRRNGLRRSGARASSSTRAASAPTSSSTAPACPRRFPRHCGSRVSAASSSRPERSSTSAR